MGTLPEYGETRDAQIARTTTIDFSELEGKVFKFYGVDGEAFKLNDAVLEAMEDPNDGYRSSLGHVRQVPEEEKHVFFGEPVDTVMVHAIDSLPGGSGVFQGWAVESVVSDHVWLYIGTDNIDDYYPTFTFQYHPMTSKPDPVGFLISSVGVA